MKIKKQKNTSKKPVIIGAICAVLVLFGGIAAAYWYISKDKNNPQAGTNKEAEISKNNPDNKKVPGENNSTDTTPNKEGDSEQTPQNNLAPVTPFINYFGRTGSQLEVDAIVPNINEEGTCTLTVRNEANSVVYTATKPAHAGAQTTRCENFLFPDTGATSAWKATVSYKSTTYSGDSQAASFN